MSRRIGRLTEALAALFLLLRGLRIIGRNYFCAYGEIDLIALHRERRRKASTLVFVEVRYRSSESLGSAAASIDVHKQFRLIKSANHFVHRHQHYSRLAMRFDAVLITWSARLPRITWIKDIFDT